MYANTECGNSTIPVWMHEHEQPSGQPRKEMKRRKTMEKRSLWRKLSFHVKIKYAPRSTLFFSFKIVSRTFFSNNLFAMHYAKLDEFQTVQTNSPCLARWIDCTINYMCTHIMGWINNNNDNDSKKWKKNWPSSSPDRFSFTWNSHAWNLYNSGANAKVICIYSISLYIYWENTTVWYVYTLSVARKKT